jgi:hypothetical protein
LINRGANYLQDGWMGGVHWILTSCISWLEASSRSAWSTRTWHYIIAAMSATAKRQCRPGPGPPNNSSWCWGMRQPHDLPARSNATDDPFLTKCRCNAATPTYVQELNVICRHPQIRSGQAC